MTQQATIEVRRYRAGDRDAVMALAPRLTEWVPTWRDPAAVLAAACGWVSGSADKAGDPDRAFFVAVTGGQVVGLVGVGEQAHFSGQIDAYVGELVVAPSWEGRGIGSQLMRAAENWAAGRGLSFICLDTGADNGPARGLYSSLGYTLEAVRLTKPVAQPG
jgi:ribosomal protein S18 acetylase RimI-like enzyme